MNSPSSLALLCCIALSAQRLAGQQTPGTQAIFDQAAAAMQAGQFAQAEQGFKVVLTSDPSNVASLGDLGVLYARTHRLAEAIAVDQRALGIAPGDTGLLLNLGLAYLKQEDYDRARPYLQQLLDANPSDRRVILLLSTAEILGAAPAEGLKLLLSGVPGASDSSSQYLEAVAYARVNRLADATAVFNRLLADSRTRAQANLLLGEALHDAKHYLEAISALKDALRQEPPPTGAHRELGKVYISTQQFTDAERELRAAITEDPQDASATYFLGALLVQNSRYAEGASLLEHARVQLSDSWAAVFYLGKAQLRLGHALEAVTTLEQAAAMNADEPELFYTLAQAQRAAGHPDQARIAMDRVVALHSSALDAEKQAVQHLVVGAH